MFKILVFSDTHGSYDSCISTIEQNPDTSLIIHAGDCYEDAEELSYIFRSIPIEFVRGNNDFFSNGKDEKLLNILDKKIFVTHGHTYNVKFGMRDLTAKAEELGADVVVFGHTHKASMEQIGRTVFLNPGATRCLKPMYGEILIDDYGINTRLLPQDD